MLHATFEIKLPILIALVIAYSTDFSCHDNTASASQLSQAGHINCNSIFELEREKKNGCN